MALFNAHKLSYYNSKQHALSSKPYPKEVDKEHLFPDLSTLLYKSTHQQSFNWNFTNHNSMPHPFSYGMLYRTLSRLIFFEGNFFQGNPLYFFSHFRLKLSGNLLIYGGFWVGVWGWDIKYGDKTLYTLSQVIVLTEYLSHPTR